MANRRELRRIEALLSTLEPQVRQAFIAAILSARRSVNLADLEAALRAGDIARAVELLRMNTALLFPLDTALVGGYAAGGAMVVDTARLAGVVLGFDGRHVRAEQWARDHVGGLIREIAEDQAAMARTVVTAQIEAGRAPRAIVTELVGRVTPAGRTGGFIGLTERQAEYATRARAELQSLDRNYFTRELRDRRFDGTVRRAIREGRPLSAADLDRITGRYRDRLLAHRAQTIARTESITALRAGRREGYQQAIDAGQVRNDLLTRVWDATLDSRTRPDHVAMHAQTVQGIEAPWVMPDGSQMMFPGDGSLGASAATTVNCRCYESFRVDWLRTANR